MSRPVFDGNIRVPESSCAGQFPFRIEKPIHFIVPCPDFILLEIRDIGRMDYIYYVRDDQKLLFALDNRVPVIDCPRKRRICADNIRLFVQNFQRQRMVKTAVITLRIFLVAQFTVACFGKNITFCALMKQIDRTAVVRAD